MQDLITFLKGKKSFIVAALTVIYALTGAASGQLSWNMAIILILPIAGGIAGLRSAIASVEEWLPYLEQVISAQKELTGNATTTDNTTTPAA